MTKLKIYNNSYHFYKNNISQSIHDIPHIQNILNYIEWCENGMYHRLNGPAVIYYNGVKQWWKNGEHIKTEYPKND